MGTLAGRFMTKSGKIIPIDLIMIDAEEPGFKRFEFSLERRFISALWG
jgi:hypothetical protein